MAHANFIEFGETVTARHSIPITGDGMMEICILTERT